MAKNKSEIQTFEIRSVFTEQIYVDGLPLEPNETRVFKEMNQELENLERAKYILIEKKNEGSPK